MIKVLRTNSENSDFTNLVDSLNSYLKVMDGAEHDFYNQYNNIDVLNHVVLVFLNDVAAGCGAFKRFDTNSVEIKRMYTHPEFRSQGIASKVLLELEKWAKEEAFNVCVLETGKRQTEAVSFYKKMNYTIIPNYGQYKNISNSICFKKELN
ncbi:GNAT family N-acetyltransferase [uncultured Algibacter sp.]|uniref:GNAT family N-acetyltransferase n=1 Tax=uncultured Algibacter sp. TaxID=298659 RepID=UPI00262A01F7|nr:GNAT family N-acetyltransferase [uncultured Algibacter sp.]